MRLRSALSEDSYGRTVSTSPATSPTRRARPAANSTTAKARSATATRRAGTLLQIFTTRPARVTNTISIEKRMKNVCTAFVGAITIPVVSSSPSRPRRPLRRLTESTAISSVVTTGSPVRSFTRAKVVLVAFRAGVRNVPTKTMYRLDELEALEVSAQLCWKVTSFRQMMSVVRRSCGIRFALRTRLGPDLTASAKVTASPPKRCEGGRSGRPTSQCSGPDLKVRATSDMMCGGGALAPRAPRGAGLKPRLHIAALAALAGLGTAKTWQDVERSGKSCQRLAALTHAFFWQIPQELACPFQVCQPLR
jgi:hypothetical protein